MVHIACELISDISNDLVTPQSYPLVNSQGKMLLPPAEAGEGCPTPTYANPKQILRILKRREMKRRLAFSGKLSKRVQVSQIKSKECCHFTL